MPKKGRKLILVREDLLQKASKITAKEGKTMFAFTNKLFENALKAHDMQTDLDEVLELYAIMMLGDDLGLAVLPSRLLDYMVNNLHNSDRENLMYEAHKAGIWFGRCLRVKFPEEEIIETFENIMKKYMWRSVDLDVIGGNGTVELKCVSPTLSEDKTEVLFDFILGFFEALDYRLTSENCVRGIIQMCFNHSSIENVWSESEKRRILQKSESL